MKLRDKVWRAFDYGVREGTVSEFTRGDSTCDEFFATEAEAWEAVAEINRKDAEHKELAAEEARHAEQNARAKAAAAREGIKR